MADISTIIADNSVLIAAIFGGAGVKVLDKLLARKNDAFDHAETIRTDMSTQINALREEIASNRNEINAKRRETDEWRAKYWLQVEETIELKAEIEGLRTELEMIKVRVFGPHFSPPTGSVG